MSLTFKIVDVPVVAGGKAPEPNPFEPAAKAAVQAQEQGKAIAFPLDVTGFEDSEKTVDGETVKFTASDNAAAYAVRKIRELGKPFDRTFTVVVNDGVVTVAAKERITRTKKEKTAETVSVDAAPTA